MGVPVPPLVTVATSGLYSPATFATVARSTVTRTMACCCASDAYGPLDTGPTAQLSHCMVAGAEASGNGLSEASRPFDPLPTTEALHVSSVPSGSYPWMPARDGDGGPPSGWSNDSRMASPANTPDTVRAFIDAADSAGPAVCPGDSVTDGVLATASSSSEFAPGDLWPSTAPAWSATARALASTPGPKVATTWVGSVNDRKAARAGTAVPSMRTAKMRAACGGVAGGATLWSSTAWSNVIRMPSVAPNAVPGTSTAATRSGVIDDVRGA